MIRQEGGLVPTTWDKALGAVLNGLRVSHAFGGNTVGKKHERRGFSVCQADEKAFPDCALEVFYQERELSEVQKILMSPDRSPNFRGAREMGVSSNGGFEPLMRELFDGHFSGAYVVGEDLHGHGQ
mgnify:CR=1 FL=1